VAGWTNPMQPLLPSLRLLNRRRKLAFMAGFLRAYPASSVLLVGAGGSGSPFEQMIERGIAARVPFVVASDIRFIRNSTWTFVVCDSRRLPFKDGAFDLVVANAVIEHVGGAPQQARLVDEHRRVGRHWIVTTPNRWFPVEAHTGVVLRHFSAGWRRGQAETFTRLLSRRELRRLLPVDAAVRGRWYSPTFVATSARVPRRRAQQRATATPGPELVAAFRRAAARASASRLERLRQAPVRTLAVKGIATLGARTNRTWSHTTRTFWGDPMRVMAPEAVSNQLIRFGLTEPGLTAYLLRLLRPGDRFVDVGAHFGYFTLLAARLVGDEGEVHAFEPTPSTFRILAGNVGQRANVVLNQVAAWSHSEVVTISDLGSRLSAFNSLFPPRLEPSQLRRARATPVQVEAVSLDDYCRKVGLRPTFVKIDAESAERQILEGMRRLLDEDRPVVTVEVGDFGVHGAATGAELLRSVMAQNYQPLELHAGRLRPHVPLHRYSYDNILLVPVEHALARGDEPLSTREADLV
jgi:FkbM family methyltransferase